MTGEKRQWKERTPEEIEIIKEKAEKRRKKNFSIITNHIDSVCIIPADKPASARYALVQMIFVADRMITTLKRQVGFVLPFDTARQVLGNLDEFIESIWAYVIKTSPHLYSFDKRRWRELNDPMDIKLKLVEGRNFVAVILPRSEEIGQLAVAAKILENHILYVRSTGPFDKIEESISAYRSIIEDFDEFLTGLSEKIGVEYDSPIKKLINQGAMEHGQESGETSWPPLTNDATSANQEATGEKNDKKKRKT
ncbi:MAG TPA: hypothetical protein DDW94_11200 [Deltaproteobacteria bacterium]|nr:MAG: hypothetical protein A2Z79_04760 [Deltaproteobacteria bacterium GWA2_55_82]OIJ72636.1 MAG: hypothetical protein A2V21_312330 [Deltaproteobacteria bacterium GWC2_55_46]HBG47537.1 hypothetical protein [Deltaproteobacteria bacterium]HCY10448.1 hypothetical protein [Deltaproteobacteria bacterium]